MRLIVVAHCGYRYRDENGPHEFVSEHEVKEMLKDTFTEIVFAGLEAVKNYPRYPYDEKDTTYLHINPQQAILCKEYDTQETN